jgi:hypothetical protein
LPYAQLLGNIRIELWCDLSREGFEMTFIPITGISQANGLANAEHAAHTHDRMRGAENRAELNAMRVSRFPTLRRLLNRLTRRSR